jgi:hypothetical protein
MINERSYPTKRAPDGRVLSRGRNGKGCAKRKALKDISSRERVGKIGEHQSTRIQTGRGSE